MVVTIYIPTNSPQVLQFLHNFVNTYCVLFFGQQISQWVSGANCDFELLLFSHYVMSDYLRSHGLQHARFPCFSLSPRVCSDSCPLSWWSSITISSSAAASFCFQSFPASGSFPTSWLITSGGQSIGASPAASDLPMNIQDWFPLGLTGFISFLSKGLSRVFSNTTVK